MKKKIGLILLSLMTLSFSLTGCGGSKQKEVKQVEVNIDFDVNSVSNGTFKMDYPKDDWSEIPVQNDKIKVNLIYNDSDPQSPSNLNVSRSLPLQEGYSIEKYSKEALKSIEEQSEGTLTIENSEIMKIGEKNVVYSELNFKITDKFIKKAIKESGMTEKEAKEAGFEKILSSMPESKQIQMHLIDEQNEPKTVTIFTGTYLDDSQKEDVLKAIETMIQTAQIEN